MYKIYIFFTIFTTLMLDTIYPTGQISTLNRKPAYTIEALSTTNRYTGYTISSSGNYYLSNDLILSPYTSNYTGILINASNVTLDLNGYALLITTSGNTPAGPIYGIQIAPDKKNITIQHGTINGQGISSPSLAAGIYASGTTLSPNKNITLKDIVVLSCQQYGIYLDNCNELVIDEVLTYGIVNSKKTGFAAGIYLNASSRGTLTNSSFNETSFQNTGQGASYGLYANECKNIQLNNIATYGNTITSVNREERSGVYGIYLNQCAAFKCVNVQSIGNQHLGLNTNSTAGNECCGIYLNNTTGSIFEQCIANNNIGGYQYGSNYTCSTYGFKLTSSSAGNTFSKCEASSNAGAADCAGFMIGQSGCNIFESCLSINNTSTKANFSSRYSYGFTTTFCSNNYYSNCKAMGNYVASRISNKGYGFALRTEKYSTVQDCVANTNGTASATDLGEGYGIALTDNCYLCNISHNRMYGNLGATKHYGFKDFSANFQSFLNSNASFGHGKIGTSKTIRDNGALNYFVQFNPAISSIQAMIIDMPTSSFSLPNCAGGRDLWINYSINSN